MTTRPKASLPQELFKPPSRTRETREETAVARADGSQSTPKAARTPATPSLRTPRPAALSEEAKAPPANDEAALTTAREKEKNFLRGTDTYASTFGAMMRGLVQTGSRGQQAAELIANSSLSGKERADLVSELASRWVRNDADASIAWANSLTVPEDFRAAIPNLVAPLDNDRVSRTVEAHLNRSHRK